MSLRTRIGDRDAEQMLRGEQPSPRLDQVAAFVGLARASLPTRPDPAMEAVLVPRLADAARAAGERAGGLPHSTRVETSNEGARPRPGLRRAAIAAACAALVPAATAGLALAGVTLPEPARKAMESIGLELPNQSAVEQSGGTETPAPGARDARPGPRRPDSGAGRGAGERGSGGARNGRGGSKGGRGRGERARGAPARPSPPASSGQGTPQHGAPAPIAPPGQGGTPPGQGGTSPSNDTAQGAPPVGGGAPAGSPPGQAEGR